MVNKPIYWRIFKFKTQTRHYFAFAPKEYFEMYIFSSLDQVRAANLATHTFTMHFKQKRFAVCLFLL